MTGGAIAMLAFIVIVVFGGTGVLLKQSMKRKDTSGDVSEE